MDGADLGVRVRRLECVEVISRFAFLDFPDRRPVGPEAGEAARGPNQMSPPSASLNSLNELNGTTHRFSTPSHLVQCLLFTLRMLVVPESGCIFKKLLEVDRLSFRRYVGNLAPMPGVFPDGRRPGLLRGCPLRHGPARRWCPFAFGLAELKGLERQALNA
jgi:hypothetical protein